MLSLHGSYRQMAKESHENFKLKVVSDSNIITTMNYLHGAK